mgnify:CR=1 FL=1
MTPTTTSTSNVTSSATQSLLTSLNTGSGVDTANLVTSLVQAQFAAKTAALTAKTDALTAQISSATALKSTMGNFGAALQSLVKGGTLTSQPLSSNSAALGATALSGAKLSNLSRSISVDQLATAQGARSSVAIADRTAPIASGSFTLTLGKATYSPDGSTMTAFDGDSANAITIDVANASLDDIAIAINAKKAGVTATVVTDGMGGAFLSLKGQTGANQAFTLAATDDVSGNLAQFAVGVGAPGTTLTSGAVNAKLTVDGIAVERASNTISDLVDGVKLQLNQVTTGAVSLTSTPPTTALKNAVADFVDTYNLAMAQVIEQANSKTGVLKSDTAARALMSSLQSLTTQSLSSDVSVGTPNSLAAIGVRTNRDGTLEVDSAALDKALADDPDAVEAMFAYSPIGTSGISAQLDKIVNAANSTIYGLGASISSYTSTQSTLAKQQAALTDQSEQMTTRLTQQFSSMNAKISAYKATQSFLDNQIKAWNKGDS